MKEKHELIFSREFNIVDSIFLCHTTSQSRHVLNPIFLMLMVLYELPIHYLFILCCVYSVLNIMVNAHCLHKNKQLSIALHRTFYANIIKHTSVLVLCVIFILHCLGYLYSFILIIVLLAYIISMSFRAFISRLPQTSVDLYIFDIFESIQFLLIGLKWVNIINFSWEATLFFYTFVVWGLVILGVGASFFLAIFWLTTISTPSSEPQIKTATLFHTWSIYYVTFRGISFYYLFRNIKIFLETDGLRHDSNAFITDATLIPMCIFYCVGGMISLIVFIKLSPIFKRYLALKLMVVRLSLIHI